MSEAEGHRELGGSDALGSDLDPWHESSWTVPALEFVAVFGLWVSALAVGLWSEHGLLRAAMTVPASLAVGQMFTIGHDAGHGSYSTSSRLNGVVGRLALATSIHVFALWRLHHDVHHRYTCLRSGDYVWTPMTVGEFEALPRWRQALHRLYRNRSGLGLGLHYAIEIWAPRMLWPRARHGLRPRGRLLADTIMLYGILAAVAAAVWGFVAIVRPQQLGDTGFWLSVVLLLFVIPLVAAQWVIGFVIYLNHTHPDIVWFDDPTEWSRHQVQLEESSGLRFSPWRHWFLPRRIMHHTAHHVDPRVPLRRLKDAQQHLVDTFGDRVVSYRWSMTTFRNVLTCCKLYDYQTQTWLTYAAVEERQP